MTERIQSGRVTNPTMKYYFDSWKTARFNQIKKLNKSGISIKELNSRFGKLVVMEALQKRGSL